MYRASSTNTVFHHTTSTSVQFEAWFWRLGRSRAFFCGSPTAAGWITGLVKWDGCEVFLASRVDNWELFHMFHAVMLFLCQKGKFTNCCQSLVVYEYYILPHCRLVFSFQSFQKLCEGEKTRGVGGCSTWTSSSKGGSKESRHVKTTVVSIPRFTWVYWNTEAPECRQILAKECDSTLLCLLLHPSSHWSSFVTLNPCSFSHSFREKKTVFQKCYGVLDVGPEDVQNYDIWFMTQFSGYVNFQKKGHS